MHIPVDETRASITAVRRVWQGPIGAYPNNVSSANRFAASASSGVSIQEFITAADEWREAGATLVGGCCGIGPAYIKALHNHWSTQEGKEGQEGLCRPCA